MLNQVVLIGRLVKKPELRESEAGMSYVKATIAVQSSYKNKNGDYETNFLEFSTFGKNAVNISKFCDKGSLISLVGSLSNNIYTDKNGITHYQMSLIANKISFLSKSNKKIDKIEDGEIFILGQ